jgi:TatD DNase family protein
VRGWTDSHCHLQEEFLDADDTRREAVVSSLARAHEAGVTKVVVIGTGERTSEEALALAHGDTGEVEAYATIGLHPHDASTGTDWLGPLARGAGPRLVGIGECGLDYYYEHSARDEQRRAFAAQVALAHELSLALVIHARDAWDDLFEVLASEGVPERTVIHCFTGGPAEAERCLEAGCDISVAGIVTFKNADELRAAIKVTPLDRLHVETDSPFLAPVPHRGRPNEPAFVAAVGSYVAELLGVPVDDLRETTAANSSRLFRLDSN